MPGMYGGQARQDPTATGDGYGLVRVHAEPSNRLEKPKARAEPGAEDHVVGEAVLEAGAKVDADQQQRRNLHQLFEDRVDRVARSSDGVRKRQVKQTRQGTSRSQFEHDGERTTGVDADRDGQQRGRQAYGARWPGEH